MFRVTHVHFSILYRAEVRGLEIGRDSRPNIPTSKRGLPKGSFFFWGHFVNAARDGAFLEAGPHCRGGGWGASLS